MIQTRRSFLRFSLFCAPAIVCAANIMPVRALVMPEAIDTQEIIAILAGRLEAGAYRFDEASCRWVGGKYVDTSKYVRSGPYDILYPESLA